MGFARFLSGDRGTARVYLQNLVDHIVIGEDEIVIEAKAGAALAMMAASRPAASESTSGEVLADVVDWRPSGDGSKNLTLVVSNPAKRQRVPEPPPKPPEVPRIVRFLEQARRWRGVLDRGEASSAAAIAARAGFCAVYVRNLLFLLFLLRLHPAILTAIERLGPGEGDDVTERWLRPITRMPQARQR